MPRNLVICLDGTNNRIKSAVNTNVLRLFAMLALDEPTQQVAYYRPGVGTFSSPGAWTPPARAISRVSGLALGVGLKETLGDAYSFLIRTYEPGDRIFVFGFSRGAYTARALTGMLDVFGIFRPGSESLVPYAVNAYAGGDHDERRSKDYFAELRMYATTHGRKMPGGHRDHVGVPFLGVWDTVKAAGTFAGQLRWPFTRQLPHVATIRHAVSIDEARRPYADYLIYPPSEKHIAHRQHQDLQQVWFPGVHSDVGGMFEEGAHLSDIPLKWMTDEALDCGLLVAKNRYAAMAKLEGVDPTADIHRNGKAWKLLGPGRRTIPAGASVHASVQERISVHPDYQARLPQDFTYVDADWRTPRPIAPAPAASHSAGTSDVPHPVAD